MIWGFLALVVAFVFTVFLRKLFRELKQPGTLSEEELFWANKCHESFNEAQRAYGLEDWYSFHKFCDQHALYYRRYKMARDGHFERKSE